MRLPREAMAGDNPASLQQPCFTSMWDYLAYCYFYTSVCFVLLLTGKSKEFYWARLNISSFFVIGWFVRP